MVRYDSLEAGRSLKFVARRFPLRLTMDVNEENFR